MTIIAEFRDSIGTAIPKIVALLSDETQVIRWVAADALAQLAQHGRLILLYFGLAPLTGIEDCSRVSSIY